MVLISTGRLALPCISKPSCYFHTMLGWCMALLHIAKLLSRHTVHQEWESGTNDMGKWHSEEQCFQYNYMLFILAIFRTRRNEE